MPPVKQDPAARYLSKVDERGPDDCWLWTASCHKNGYGQFFDGDRMTTAHRFGYLLRCGPLAPGQCVLHRCDNPPCQNPGHWFVGTQHDNAVDREQKSRGNHPRGPKVGTARLVEADVIEILARYQRGDHAKAIADDFNISVTHVNHIAHGTKWAHVPRPPVTRKRTGNPRLTDDDVREIRRERARGVPLHVLSERFGTNKSNISHIALRRTRASVPDDPQDPSAGL